MSRRRFSTRRTYGEPVEAVAPDGKPVRYTWREQHYEVLNVVEHWVISKEWRQRSFPANACGRSV